MQMPAPQRPVERDQQLLAPSLRDELRPEAAEVWPAEAHRRLPGDVMLTGDNHTAVALAPGPARAGTCAELRPGGQGSFGRTVAGPGNPPRWLATESTTLRPWPPPTWESRWAPAGTDVAIETADVALIRPAGLAL